MVMTCETVTFFIGRLVPKHSWLSFLETSTAASMLE